MANDSVQLHLNAFHRWTSALSNEATDAIDRSVTGNILDEPAPPIEPGVTEVPFACGPQAAE